MAPSKSRSFTIGIAGVTGKFAGLVLDTLLNEPDVQLRGYCRNSSKLASRYAQSPQLEVLEGDAMDEAALGKFARGLDAVICAYLGDNQFMIDAQKALIDACNQAKVPRYIASDYTFDYTKLQLGQHPTKDPMKIIHEYVKEKQHVEGVHIMIGAFMEVFWSGYMQVWRPEDKTLIYWGNGTEKWESTTYGDAAKYTAAVALDSQAVGIRRFLGDRKSIQEISLAIAKAYGIEPKLQREGSLDELYAKMHDVFKKDPSDIYAWLPFFYQYYCINGQTFIFDKLDNAKYPHVEPRTFQDFLSTHTLNELSEAVSNLRQRN